MTKKQQNDIECIKWFIPECCKSVEITDEDIKMFLEFSDQGKHKDKIGTWAMDKKYQNGLNALCEGKKWRGIHIHELYEQGVLDGSMPYFVLLGGFDKTIKRKWWQIWKPKFWHEHNPMPRVVVDFLKKEMFKGNHAEIIESCYQDILKDKSI